MDRSELERRIEEHHPHSFGWAMACCSRDFDDAEEVLQSTYLKILEGKARFDERSSFKTWLFAVIRRTALERFRWKRTRERLSMLLGFAERGDQPERADDRLERSEAAEHLLRALATIARRQREVLELVFYHDMTIEDAAHTLGISIGTARVHYGRGKKRLLARLSEEKRIAIA